MHFGNMKFHGFHGNLLLYSKEWGCTYKNSHISAATHHIIIINLAPSGGGGGGGSVQGNPNWMPGYMCQENY